MNKQAFIAGYQKESSDRIEKSLDWITGLFPDYYDKSPYARKMLRETVRQETLDNAYRGSGHDGGVAQITRDTFKYLMNLKHKHPKTYRRIQNSPADRKSVV